MCCWLSGAIHLRIPVDAIGSTGCTEQVVFKAVQDLGSGSLLGSAEIADGEVFELVPNLLNLCAQRLTRKRGFDQRGAPVGGIHRPAHEAGQFEPSDRSRHGGRIGVQDADQVNLALGASIPQMHHEQFLPRMQPSAPEQLPSEHAVQPRYAEDGVADGASVRRRRQQPSRSLVWCRRSPILGVSLRRRLHHSSILPFFSWSHDA